VLSSTSADCTVDATLSITSIWVGVSPNALSTSLRPRAKSYPLRYRASDRLCMLRASTCSSSGTDSRRPVGCTASRSIRAISELAWLGPPGSSNGERPASSAYTVAPRAYTSVRASAYGSEPNSSGADQGTDIPSASATVSICAEMPKSVSADQPYSVTSTLAGLMSRCRMPARCAVSTALASRTPIRSASCTAMVSRRYRTDRFGRGQYSITMHGRPSGAMPAK